ncbi:MAG: MFS transporter [Ignisphaera sp.]
MARGYTSKTDIYMVLSVTTLVNFLTGFNARLAVVGLPSIARDLGADIYQIVWIVQGYMLGSTVIQLIVGRLSDLFGRVRLFNLGIAIFGLGAFISGLSTSPILLIVSRCIQGVGAAFLISLTVTILTDNVPPNRLATWLGINQVSWRVGALLGLTLSGFIIDYLGWRWIFLVQAPLSLAILLWSAKKLKERYKPVEKPYIDWLGFTSFTAAIALLLIGLTLYGYGFSKYSLYTMISGIALLLFFSIWELNTGHPALDLSIFRLWQFSGGIVAQLLYSIGFGASMTLLAIYLQSVKGFTATQTGLLLIPYELSFLVFGVVGGRLSDSIGFVPVAVAGLAAGSVALYIISMVSSLNTLIVAELLLGVGTGLFVSPNTSSIMNSVPPHRRGIASSIRTISFNIGFALSLNIAVLSLTQVLPYEIVSKLITYERVQNTSESSLSIEISMLSKTIKHSFKVQSILMAIAIPFTVSRTRKSHEKIDTLFEA